MALPLAIQNTPAAIGFRFYPRRFNGYLSRTSRNIEHIGWNRMSRQMAAQGSVERASLGKRNAKVRRAWRQIGVMQIVGFDPERYQTPKQISQRGRLIIHPTQEHGLPEQRNTAIRESSKRCARRVTEFTHVVDMHGKPDRFRRS